MFSIIIVEDDFMQREVLKKMILSAHEFIEIYEADSESTALDIIKRHDIDMFLIDISLRESSGLDLAMKIRKIDKYEFSQIIFLTTHMEYITQAFKKTHCYDYIIKPYDQETVQAMLSKLICYESSRLNNGTDNFNEDNKNNDRKVSITLKNGIYALIKIKDIVFIEIKGRVGEVNTINGMYEANNTSLKKIMKLIDCKYIIQSHRAFAVNKNYICKIEKINAKLSTIYFNNYVKTALLGYNFKDNIISEVRNEKVILC
ncbi:LytTR family DNA-binding domain-containing protein [Clostridium sp.]|uniref:LytR/AlgR family response regulator transcription factor n=1 Tax=Clostridium sp. TaxID=1506 RepID=UPI00260B62D9|nr:LytTR family DNA-binding domain-containing protein [Clostridium sp.]